jgi:hypothetical protein
MVGLMNPVASLIWCSKQCPTSTVVLCFFVFVAKNSLQSKPSMKTWQSDVNVSLVARRINSIYLQMIMEGCPKLFKNCRLNT